MEVKGSNVIRSAWIDSFKTSKNLNQQYIIPSKQNQANMA